MSEPVEFDSSIPSNLSAGLALQEQIVQQMERFAYSMRDIFAVRLSLEEGISNSIKHGNKLDESWAGASTELRDGESTGIIDVRGHIAEPVSAAIVTFASGATVNVEVQSDGYFLTSFRDDVTKYDRAALLSENALRDIDARKTIDEHARLRAEEAGILGVPVIGNAIKEGRDIVKGAPKAVLGIYQALSENTREGGGIPA